MIDEIRTKAIQEALSTALKPFLAENNLKLMKQKAEYYADATAELKITLNFIEADANPFAEYFKTVGKGACPEVRLDWLGKTFNHAGETHKIVGYKKGARKMPIITEANGKNYQVPLEAVYKAFGDPRPEWMLSVVK